MDKNPRLNLPKPHLSASSMLLWKNSQQKFIDKYIWGIEGTPNPYALYGKQFATWCETGDWSSASALEQTILKRIVRYDLREHEYRETLQAASGEFELLAYFDSFDPEKFLLRDQKTGTTPWTQSKVDGYFPIRLYAGLIYKKTGKLPKVYIDWIPTHMQDGVVRPVGNLKTFVADITVTEILQTLREASRLAEEIHQWYCSYEKTANEMLAI